ncbi:MAG: DUF2194 domain-containing protein [Actinobacteria bacterium]|nr:DUF2194 domain-containing protein [Actinomycetota bacterium]
MFTRKLSVIIIALLVLAAGFQLLRSFGMLNLVKNVNSLEELPEAASPEIPANIDFEKYLIVSNNEEPNSAKTEEQLKATFDFMKKEYQIISINQQTKNLSDYDCIFLTFERFDFLKNLNDYIDYVNAGGNLVFLVRPIVDKSFEIISGLIGIKNYTKNVINTKGIKVVSDVMIGANGFESKTENILNSSINLELTSDIEPLLESYTDIPLLWEKDYGKGRFIVFNGTFLNEKNNRGILAGIIGIGKDNLIYPIINVKMLHIDDFPAPIPAGRDEKIYEEFSRDIPQFYKEVWWTDMIKISKKFDIKYSSFAIESYNDNTKLPLVKGDSKDMQNLLIYGKELLGIGGEMGLHGYNHQSLALQGFIKQDLGYMPWKSENDMAESVKELVRFMKSVFSQYSFRAYVPPSNILSPEGRKAVLTANPDLKIISSVYLPNKERDVYTQELSIADDGIIEFPRISAGYENKDETMWSIYNGVNLYGLFAHFVHPDDVLDPERNGGKSWDQLSKEFASMVGQVTQSYKWLRSFTISSASQELVKYLESKPKIEYGDNTITIYTENFRPDIYCIMRTKSKIIESEKVDYLKISENAYLLTLKDAVSNLKLEAE